MDKETREEIIKFNKSVSFVASLLSLAKCNCKFFLENKPDKEKELLMECVFDMYPSYRIGDKITLDCFVFNPKMFHLYENMDEKDFIIVDIKHVVKRQVSKNIDDFLLMEVVVKEA